MKWFAYSILAIFILISFMPSVQAVSEDETNSIIDIDFQPYFIDSNTTVVNMADKASMVYEKDKVLGALPGIEGKYHGPYLESSSSSSLMKVGTSSSIRTSRLARRS